MAKVATKQQIDFWQSRRGSLTIGVLSLLAAYLIGSRAIDTGSLQQYVLTLFLLAFAVNRLVKTLRH